MDNFLKAFIPIQIHCNEKNKQKNKYIAMVVNTTVANRYQLLCCFRDPLYQLCFCVISPVTLGRSFRGFGPQDGNTKLPKSFLALPSEDQEHSLVDGVLKF